MSLPQALRMGEWQNEIMEVGEWDRALISSRELHLTGSVRSSSAPSIHPLKAEAFRANCRYSSSTFSHVTIM